MTFLRTTQCLAVVPAFNEEKAIADVVRRIRRTTSIKEVLVVDDCSTDGTAQAARAAGATVVSHVFNLGYGAAIETGYKYADQRGYGTVVQLDGDGQHEPGCIPDLLRAMQKEKADVVIGSRFLGASQGYRPSFLRRTGMRFFQLVIRLTIGKSITDPTSGYQAINRAVVRFFVTNNMYPPDYPDADILILLHNVGFKVVEIPVAMYENQTGKSMHSGFRPLYYMVKMLLSIFSVLFGNYRTFLRRTPPCR